MIIHSASQRGGIYDERGNVEINGECPYCGTWVEVDADERVYCPNPKCTSSAPDGMLGRVQEEEA
jgi:hypothetical protein